MVPFRHGASDVRRADERNDILRCLKDVGADGVAPKDLESLTGMPSGNVCQLLLKMVQSGEISKSGHGRYLHPDASASKNDNKVIN